MAGIAGLSAALITGIGDARAHNLVMGQTEAVIKSTGSAAGFTADQIAEMAGSLSAASGKSLFGDDDIQRGQNMLLTFTNITTKLPETTQVMLDMAQALGTDAGGAALQLGKALNNPMEGISALTRVGVTFTEEQKAQIKTMQEAGDMAGAQAVILAELNKEFGGSAAAAAAADGGMAQFKDRLGELAESIGTQVLPMLNQLMAWLNSPAIQTAITNIGIGLVDAVKAAIVGFSSFLTTIQPVVGFVQDNLTAILAALAAMLIWIVVPAFVAWATAAGAAAIATITALAPVLLPIAAIGAAVGLLVTAWENDWGGIQEKTAAVWSFIQDSTQAVIATLSRFWTEIQPQLVAAWTTIQTSAQTVWLAIQSVITSVMGPVVAELSRFWTEIQPQLVAAWNNIQSVTQTVWAAVQSVISAVVTAIAGAVSIAWSAIQTTITTVSGAVLGFVQANLGTIQSIFSGIWTVIQGIVQTAWALISGIISTGLSLLQGDWSGAWENIKSTFSGAWEGIKTILSGALMIVKSEISLAWEAIKTLTSTAWETLRSTVETKIGEVVTIAQGLPGRFTAALSSLAGDLLQMGKDAIQGLVNGIKSIDVGSVLGSILTSGIAAAKAAAGIRSPSTKTRDEIGKPMGEGIVVGIEGTATSVKQAIGKTILGAVQVADLVGPSHKAGKTVATALKDGASEGLNEATTLKDRIGKTILGAIQVATLTGDAKKFGKGVATAVKDGLATGLDDPTSVKQIFGGKLSNAVELAMEDVKQIFGGKLRDGGAAGAAALGQGLNDGWENVKQIFGGKLRELDGPAGVAGEAVARALIAGFSQVINAFDFGGTFGGAGSTYVPGPGHPDPPPSPKGPKRAMGGPVYSGTSYTVGERGPEMFVPRTSGTIIPNNKLAGGTVINNNFNVTAQYKMQQPRTIRDELRLLVMATPSLSTR